MKMKETEFTLKNIIDLMEAQGFHVREAGEIEETEAIRIEIAPKIKGKAKKGKLRWGV